jgi:tRNA(Ile)-lysidine synthase
MLHDRLELALNRCPESRHLIVGYSGGVDSHVLLHLLATRPEVLGDHSLSAIYVEHGVQPDSVAWGRHCEIVCRRIGVVFRVLRVDARPGPGESPEAAARQARYRSWEGLLGPEDAVLTAHHLDDQAETLLLQLLRGAGPRGLAAMPASAALGRGRLLRPLLEVPRTEILAYARAHDLCWIEDASNADPRFDRNYLRHEILPRLTARWPGAARALARSAGLCAEAAALTEEQGNTDLAALTAHAPSCLSIEALRRLPAARQRNALRCWFRRLTLPVPSAAQLERIQRDAVASPRDRRPHIHWPGGEVRRYRDWLFAMRPLGDHDIDRIWPLRTDTPAGIPGIGQVSLEWAPGAGLDSASLNDKRLTVRFRRGGERLRPAGQLHVRSLKKLFQEAGVPPWERSRTPLIYVGDQLAAVPGLWLEAAFAVPPDEIGWQPRWQKTMLSGTV